MSCSSRRRGRGLTLMALLLAALHVAVSLPRVDAGEVTIEDFTMQPEMRWRFFTDGVMGGVSTGEVSFAEEDGRPHARMTGDVSTANNGGFIQIRMDLKGPPPKGAVGVRLMVRGNDQRYFVHLRTTGSLLPWQYYQAGFDVTQSWTELRLPFSDFAASGVLLRDEPRPDSLTSIAIVAFGRDHAAEIDVREVGFY